METPHLQKPNAVHSRAPSYLLVFDKLGGVGVRKRLLEVRVLQLFEKKQTLRVSVAAATREHAAERHMPKGLS